MLIETTIKVGSDSCIQTFVIAFDDVDGPGHGQENKVIFLFYLLPDQLVAQSMHRNEMVGVGGVVFDLFP